MQKEHKNIDQLFKSELSDHKVVAPKFVKKQIDSKLFSKAKYLLFLIPVLVILGLFLITNGETSELSELKTTITKAKQKSITQTTNTAETNLNSFQKNKYLTNEKDLSKKQNTALKADSITLNEDPFTPNVVELKNVTKSARINTIKEINKYSSNKKDLAQKQNSLSKTNSTSLNKVSSKPNVIALKNETSSTLTNKIKGKNLTSAKLKKENTKTLPKTVAPKSKPQKPTFTPTSIPTTPKENLSNTVKNNTEDTTSSLLQFGNTRSDLAKNENPPHKDSLQNNTIVQADSTSISSLSSDSTQTENKQDLKPAITPKSRNISYLFSLSTGLNKLNASYSAVNNDDANYYQTNNSENINFEHNFSADVIFKNKFTLGSGIGLSQQSYDYTYQENITTTNTVYDSTGSTITYIYASIDTFQQMPPIDSVYQTIYDTLTNTVNSQKNSNGTSQASYLHIPIQFGYLHKMNKFMFGIQLSARYNILYKSSGQFIQDNVVTDFDKSNSIFKSSYFDFSIKTDVYYNVFNNFYINGSFKYTPQISNTYQNIPIQRKLNQFHFGLGLSYKL